MTEIPWPTAEQLAARGFVKCRDDGCHVMVDPANVPSRRCRDHQRRGRKRPARTPYIARERGRIAA